MQQLFFEMLQAWYALNVAVALMGFRSLQPVSCDKLFLLVPKKYFLYRSFRSETDFCCGKAFSCSKVCLSKDICQSYNLEIPTQHDIWIWPWFPRIWYPGYPISDLTLVSHKCIDNRRRYYAIFYDKYLFRKTLNHSYCSSEFMMFCLNRVRKSSVPC